MSGLPDFIVQSPPYDDSQLPHPYAFDDVGIRFYNVNADKDKLQQVCDELFNNLPGMSVQLRPLSNVALILVQSYPKMVSNRPAHPELGYVSQNELVFAIPVIVDDGGLIPQFGLITPYLFVDNDRSLVSGRDVIGYPKCEGRFSVPDGLPTIGPLTVHTLAPESPRGADTLWSQKLLLEIQQAAVLFRARVPNSAKEYAVDEAGQQAWPFGPVEYLYHPNTGTNPVPAAVYSSLLDAAGMELPGYHLKQFRDAADPGKACYQAVVKSHMQPGTDSFSGVGYHDAGIQLNGYPGLEIAERLGLVNTEGLIDPIIGFWYASSFSLTHAENVLVRCGGTELAAPDPGQPGCIDVIETLGRSTLKFYASVARTWASTLEDLIRD